MYKIILAIILSVFLSTQYAYAQSLYLKTISEDLQEAVLVERDTGVEWVVGEGDVVEGWSIMKIKKNCVLIRKEIEYFSNIMVPGTETI